MLIARVGENGKDSWKKNTLKLVQIIKQILEDND